MTRRSADRRRRSRSRRRRRRRCRRYSPSPPGHAIINNEVAIERRDVVGRRARTRTHTKNGIGETLSMRDAR